METRARPDGIGCLHAVKWRPCWGRVPTMKLKANALRFGKSKVISDLTDFEVKAVGKRLEGMG